MIYKLRFHELALTEWQKLDGSVRNPLKKNSLNDLRIRVFRLLPCQEWLIVTR